MIQRLCKVSSDGVSMTDMDEFVFEKGEDAPTSMAIDQEVSISPHQSRDFSHGTSGTTMYSVNFSLLE